MSALDDIVLYFPWIKEIGLLDSLREWAAEPSVTTDALVARLRASPQYKVQMAGIYRADGTMRMDESTFLDQRDKYRTILQQWNRGAYEYDKPNDFEAFFNHDMAPDELQKRLETYDSIKAGGRDVKDAFYVYAGVKLSDDDLYLMAVNPTDRQRYVEDYNKRVALNPLDYETWIKRSTEAGLDRVTSTLHDLQQQGLDTQDAIAGVRNLNPGFAAQIADALYHGQRTEGPFLSLQELMHAFQYAVIGGAATQSGLQLPTQARLDAIRSAGVDQAKAAQGYEYIAANAGTLQGGLDRMHSGKVFGTQDYEKAIFLSRAQETELLNKSQAYDKSLTQAGGGAQVRSDQQGRSSQPGLAKY